VASPSAPPLALGAGDDAGAMSPPGDELAALDAGWDEI
jgi:hypothetical protein